MTITEAVEYCRRLHNAENDDNWSDQEIYQLLYAKALEASVLGIIEATDSTTTSTAGTASYAFPTNFYEIRRVRYDGVPLKYIDSRRFESRLPTGVAPSGTPREYTIIGETIILVPTPSTSSETIQIIGRKRQSRITTSTSTIDVPDEFHACVCDGAIGEMFMKDLNYTAAQIYLGRWENVHKPAMREFAKRRRRVGSPITVIDADSNLETEFGVV